MMQRRTRRLAGFALVAGAAVVGATFTRVAPTVAQQGKPLVRGNAYGEWRHWGADQWSTRYSLLEQVNASNFDSLQVAWEWKASAFGKDEYYRTTPIFANGRLFTVASTRRVATSIKRRRNAEVPQSQLRNRRADAEAGALMRSSRRSARSTRCRGRAPGKRDTRHPSG